MPYKDDEKRRAYQRELMRRRRAEEALGELAKVRRLPRKSRKTEPVPEAPAPAEAESIPAAEDWLLTKAQLGAQMLLVVRRHLEKVDPETISTSEAAKLADIGSRFLETAVAASQMKEEDRMNIDPVLLLAAEAQEHVEAILDLAVAAREKK